MELEKRKNNKFSNVNPSSYKENNMNSINVFDMSLKNNKNNDGFKCAIKLKRNFK